MEAYEPLSLFKVSEVEIIYRNKIPMKNRISVIRSDTAYDILLASWDMNKIELVEEFKILMLDTASRCLGISEISTGGIAGCIVDPRIVFVTALMAKASAIILAHNHPSGNLSPSRPDVAITEKLSAAGRFLDIRVHDHLIVTPQAYYSMQDEGLMPF